MLSNNRVAARAIAYAVAIQLVVLTGLTMGASAASAATGGSIAGAVTNAGSGGALNAVQVRAGRTTSNINAAMVNASVPTVSGVSPTSGPAAGRTSVTITGSNLSGATRVSFGSTAGAITSNTATQVVATSPAESAATVHITVTTAAGTSATSSADQFTYQATSTPASITTVGALYTHTNQPSHQQETISVSPAAAGDELAMAIETKFPSGVPSFTAAGVSGGGVTTWNKARSYLTIDGIHGQELWWGVVTTPGPSTITVSYTSGSTSGNSESATSLDVQEFRSSSGASTVWSLDVTGVVDTGVSTTAPDYPTLTPTSTNEAYFGYLAVPGSVSAGSTPGVVYQVDARGNQCAYDQSVSSTITPAASSSSQTFFSIGMLLKAV